MNQELSIDYINNRINQEICHNVLSQLSDEKLINEYKECNSVKNKIKTLGLVIDKYLNEQTKQQLIQDYLLELIPPGTKGVIRGNKFNRIIKDFIININLDSNRFEVCFEKKCDSHFTNEIPDWYILEKHTNKAIIGMNQLDLWGGGQQLNRGFKYLKNSEHNNPNCKLLCVVSNEIQFKSDKNKAFTLFQIGFQNNTLCYLNNLENIIKSYFSIN